MGTLQNQLAWIFQQIAQACAELDVQLVISTGGGSEPESLGELPGEPIVVKFAPQLDLLKRTSVAITHAGMNTTLEALAQGVPLLAIPVTNDQPGIAARVAWCKVGKLVPLKRATSSTIRSILTLLLENEDYATRAKLMAQAIQASPGTRLAADVIESVTEAQNKIPFGIASKG